LVSRRLPVSLHLERIRTLISNLGMIGCLGPAATLALNPLPGKGTFILRHTFAGATSDTSYFLARAVEGAVQISSYTHFAGDGFWFQRIIFVSSALVRRRSILNN